MASVPRLARLVDAAGRLDRDLVARPSPARARRPPPPGGRCARRRRCRPSAPRPVSRARRRGAAARSGAPRDARWPGRSASGRSRSRRPTARRRTRATCSKSGSPTAIAMSYFSIFSPYVPATPQHTASTCRASQPRHERHQVEGRRADAVAPLLAGGVVGHGHRRPGRSRCAARRGRGASGGTRRCRRRAAPRRARSSSSTPRISWASRFSIRPQLVEVATMSCPARA